MIDYQQKFRLKGKTAVVVGGCGLIGKEVVFALAQAGAQVIVADVKTNDVTILLEACVKQNFNVKAHSLDITDLGNLKDNVLDLVQQFGAINIWVNASYPRTKDFGALPEDITVDSWRQNVDMQMNAVALCSEYVAEHMKTNGGSIINLGSIYGVVGGQFNLYKNTSLKPVSMIYAAVKGALVNLGRYMASYYGEYNIRINTVCPGGVHDNQPKDFEKKYNEQTCLKRMAQPEEIASAALFLASDASTYITGTTFMVDGGWTAV